VRALSSTLLFTALCACAPASEATAARLLRVVVSDDRGVPLPGVPVEIEGISAMTTALDGTARVSLGREGAARARVGVACPEQYRPVEPRHVARTRSGSSSMLELAFVCRPRLRTLVVVARITGGEGLVLRADGEALGRVGSDGTLHATVQRAPDSDLRLMLDTADRPLTPRNPARELRIADRDELLVFDEQLAPVKTRVVRATVAATKPPPAPALPYAIRSTR
jgi:hypothetical protein